MHPPPNLQKGTLVTSWHSPQSIFAVGHKATTDLLLDEVLVEEKVDGSFFAFGMFDGELRCRSKGAELNLVAPERMFDKAVDAARAIAPRLVDGWTYRGEYLQKPKHNALAYDRTPRSNIILFDILRAEEDYLSYDEKVAHAEELQFEVVPRLHFGKIDSSDAFRDWLNTPSILGGQKIEGVVVKNYSRFGPEKKALFAKFVSEEFKEVHKREWKDANPQAGDIIRRLIGSYGTTTRYRKAVQHLREAGGFDESVRDIGNIIKEVGSDVESECRDEIAQALYQWAWPQIKRGMVAGVPAWWKEEMLRSALNEGVA